MLINYFIMKSSSCRTIRARPGLRHPAGLCLTKEAGFQTGACLQLSEQDIASASKTWREWLNAQRLSVLELLDREEVDKQACIPPLSDDEFENVRLVGWRRHCSSHANEYQNENTCKFRKTFGASCVTKW
jgi:hypothetical protein